MNDVNRQRVRAISTVVDDVFNEIQSCMAEEQQGRRESETKRNDRVQKWHAHITAASSALDLQMAGEPRTKPRHRLAEAADKLREVAHCPEPGMFNEMFCTRYDDIDVSLREAIA